MYITVYGSENNIKSEDSTHNLKFYIEFQL